MNHKFIRIYKKMDLEDIKEHLIIIGDTTASCAKCKSLGLKIDALQCPQCKTELKYMSFRKIKDHIPKMLKFSETRSDLTFVDFEDFERTTGALKAAEFLK